MMNLVWTRECARETKYEKLVVEVLLFWLSALADDKDLMMIA